MLRPVNAMLGVHCAQSNLTCASYCLSSRKSAFVLQNLTRKPQPNAKPRNCWSPSRLSTVQTSASADVFALDFDGVLVDSEPEISSSAVAAATEYWPDQFKGLDQSTIDGVRERLRVIRPVLVHGVESLVMACNTVLAYLLYHLTNHDGHNLHALVCTGKTGTGRA